MPEHVQLDQLLQPEPVAAGMNVYVLFSLAYLYRSTNEHVEPITIRAVSDSIFRIVDGRHRALASVIAGRKTVLARIE